MKRTLRYALTALIAGSTLTTLGCDTGAVSEATGMEARAEPDCASGAMQRALTYCASPDAALQGARVAQTREQARAGKPDTEYVPVPIAHSPTSGPAQAPVTIVLFGDFECGFCAHGYKTLRTLQANQPDKIRLVFKHLPLEFHYYARDAAQIGAVAAEQGKFWEYADALFGHDGELTLEIIEKEARALGIDVVRAKKDEAIAQLVAQDEALAETLNVDATPSIVVNGIARIGVPDQAELDQLVAEQQAVAHALSQAGVRPSDLYWRMTMAQLAPVPPEAPAQAAEQGNPGPSGYAHVPIDEQAVKGGDGDQALITIVEFADFECPFCKDAGATLDRAITSLGEDAQRVRISYRHYPLAFHQQARPAAALAVLAAAQGKFWPVHDALFEAQDALDEEAIVRVGVEAGLGSPDQVREAIADAATLERVQSDLDLGAKSGVQATPAFFVNGALHMGAPDEASWGELLRDQLAIARKVQEETSLSGDALYEAIVEQQGVAPEDLEPAPIPEMPIPEVPLPESGDHIGHNH